MTRTVFGWLVAGLALVGSMTALRGAADSPALEGVVRSEAEGLMEGVIVIAQREGSRVLTAVTTNERGQYTFPRTHVKPGKYAITIRAAGYMLPDDRVAVPVVLKTAAQLDLALQPASADQIAHQMTSVE